MAVDMAQRLIGSSRDTPGHMRHGFDFLCCIRVKVACDGGRHRWQLECRERHRLTIFRYLSMPTCVLDRLPLCTLQIQYIPMH